MKKILKKLAIFSVIFASFVGIKVNNDTKVADAALTQDYTNLTFNAGDSSIPSGFFYTGKSGNGPTIATNLNQSGVSVASAIYPTNGGGTTFPYQKPDKISDSKRWIGFTLYEDVEMEMGIFASSKKFILADDNGVLKEQTSSKWQIDSFIYQFLGVPSTGKNFYIGGTNSQQYLTFFHWSEAVPKAYFDANGGTFSDGSTRTSSIKEGASTGDPVDPVEEPTNAEGYKFLGWATSKDSTTPVSSYTIGSTYYAIWSTEKEATAINLNYKTLSLNEGDGQFLSASGYPSGSSIGSVTWTSSDPSVATVSNNGYVEAVAPGTCTVTVTNGTLSAECTIVVTTTVKYTVTFQMEGYDDKEVLVYAGGKVDVPGMFQTVKGYEVEWKKDGQVFDVENTPITSDMILVGTLIPSGHATKVVIQKVVNGVGVDLREDEAVDVKEVTKLQYVLSRDDGNPITVTNPHTWISSSIETISIDQDGNLTAHKMGRVQIRVRMYDSTDKNTITSDPIVVINSEKTDENGNIIDTTVSIVAEKGYFQAAGGSERGARFIAVVPEEYVQYIYTVKMTITARLDSDEDGVYEIDKQYEVDIKTFYYTVDYQSKTPSSGDLKKAWSQQGKVGAAVTIAKIPNYGFKGGTLSAKLTVTDKDSRLDFYAYADLSF